MQDSAGEVDQVTSGGGVDAVAQPAHDFNGQPNFLVDFSDCSLLRRLAGLDVPARACHSGAPFLSLRWTMSSWRSRTRPWGSTELGTSGPVAPPEARPPDAVS
jgi:hypothetical protein